MQAFNHYTPTEILFGPNSEDRTAEMVKKHGGTKAMIVYGTGSVKKSGLLDKVTNGMDAIGVSYTLYGGTMPNPHLSFAREGVVKAIEFGADFVLAVGGGSSIDAAKAIALGAKNPGTDIWKFWSGEEAITASYPIGVVLTLSAAGSEMSNSSVLTNTETDDKRGLGSDLIRPKFAIMNPELTYTIPPFYIACGIADIYMHTFDNYFNGEACKGIINETTDEIAEAIMRVVIRNGPLAMNDPTNYQAQSELMWCGSLSHNGLTRLGCEMDFPVHKLSHVLSAKFDVAHGASLTALCGSWARHSLHASPARFALYARKVFGVTEPNDDIAAKEGIRLTEEFFKKIGTPTNFTELGIGIQTEEILEQLADNTVMYGKRKIGTLDPLDKNGCLEVYRAANK